MRDSAYDLYPFFSFAPFGIVRIKTSNTLILADNDIVSVENNAIKSAKTVTKNKEYFIFADSHSSTAHNSNLT